MTALLLAAFLPGHVYHHAVFPVARCAQLASSSERAVPALQTLLVAALVPWTAWTTWRARDRSREEAALAVYGLVYWALPLVVGSAVSLYRAESLLLPIAPSYAACRAQHRSRCCHGGGHGHGDGRPLPPRRAGVASPMLHGGERS